MSADAANALAAFNGDARSDDADDFRRNAAILRALADAIEQAQTGWQYKSAVTLGTPDGLPDAKRVWIIPAPRLP